MSVTVPPREFQYVSFDAATIERVADTLMAALGLDRPVEIVVDETTPLTRIDVEIDDAVRIRAQSGAFEDTRHPRRQSEDATAVSLGRVLLRARDRLSGGFGEAPADDELSLPRCPTSGPATTPGTATGSPTWSTWPSIGSGRATGSPGVSSTRSADAPLHLDHSPTLRDAGGRLAGELSSRYSGPSSIALVR